MACSTYRLQTSLPPLSPCCVRRMLRIQWANGRPLAAPRKQRPASINSSTQVSQRVRPAFIGYARRDLGCVGQTIRITMKKHGRHTRTAGAARLPGGAGQRRFVCGDRMVEHGFHGRITGDLRPVTKPAGRQPQNECSVAGFGAGWHHVEKTE